MSPEEHSSLDAEFDAKTERMREESDSREREHQMLPEKFKRTEARARTVTHIIERLSDKIAGLEGIVRANKEALNHWRSESDRDAGKIQRLEKALTESNGELFNERADNRRLEERIAEFEKARVADGKARGEVWRRVNIAECRLAELMVDRDRVALVKELNQYAWRPISEIHEDYGTCVLINLMEAGCMELGSNLDKDFNEQDWTHFAQAPKLTLEQADELRAAMEDRA